MIRVIGKKAPPVNESPFVCKKEKREYNQFQRGSGNVTHPSVWFLKVLAKVKSKLVSIHRNQTVSGCGLFGKSLRQKNVQDAQGRIRPMLETNISYKKRSDIRGNNERAMVMNSN